MAVDPNIKKKADDIRNKIYGKEVRESLASGLEAMSSDVVENEGRQSVVESRQDDVESQWQNVVDETTNLDVVSAPEIIAARNGESNLKARLDKENQETTTQLAQNNLYTKDTFNYLSDGGRKVGPAVTFIADDAPKNDLTKLLPIMKEKNVPFGIGVVSEWIGKTIHSSDFNGGVETFMDIDELRYMQDNGAEILSHSANHKSMIVPSVDVESEMRSSYEKLSELGFVVDGFIYPYNDFNEDTISVAKKYYKYSFARHTNNLVGTMDNNKLNRYSLGSYYDVPSMSAKGYSTSSLEYYKERVDYAVANNEWLVFVLHTHTTNFPEEQQQRLRATIDYIQALGVDIVSPREGFNRLGNIMQVGDLKIDSSGSLTGVYEVYGGAAIEQGITGLTPITDFEKGKVSVHRVGRGDVTLDNGYPMDQVYGILKTTYLDIAEPIFSSQSFESIENSHFYVRYWQRYAKVWGEWKSKGSNVDSQQLEITDLTTSHILVGDYSIVNIKSASDGIEVNRLTNGSDGNRITIIVTSHTPVTFVHENSYASASLHLKGKVNRTLGIMESITFIKMDDSWFEV